MARGRRSAKRELAQTREIEALERAEEARLEAESKAAFERRLARKWVSERAALVRLSTLSRDLEKLHREESRMLRERDALVQMLRRSGQSWAALSSRTKLSRQALMKRMDASKVTRD
ncbi:hypothetical protein [Microbacterium sulfonylureivorans]|uniref:hypothetical protein n=1 Tax=Microbacterium sulfonylureivorans TaxID=2486854 RepID=UPI000FD8C7C3|nr:hypothetical protein [Microbacterium sulfonylureivorans]